MRKKVYLGDGVHAENDDHRIILTTSDGVAITNTIYLDSTVISALLEFIKQDI